MTDRQELEMNPWGRSRSPFDELGGAQEVRRLVDRFYDIIEGDSPLLRALLPPSTRGSREKLYEYLSGWLGGPPLYTEKRGHPQLRRRHLPFPIGDEEVVEWMRCMTEAMDDLRVPARLKAFLLSRFEPLAQHMRNRP